MKALAVVALLAAKKTTIGGQALIEGLLMIGPEKRAMAIRKSSGEILLENLQPIRLTRSSKMIFVRGSVRLFRQLVSGTKALLRSAELAEDETEADTEAPAAGSDPVITGQTTIQSSEGTARGTERKDGFFKKIAQKIDHWMENHTEAVLYFSAVLGILFSVLLFILLPNLLTGFIRQLTGLSALDGRGSTIVLNLIEGLIRISIFVTYLALTSRLKDIKRVWMYHGAEHKTIACYEDGADMTVAHVRKYSRFHPRCGTAFLFIVILVSIVVFSFVGWWGRWLNLLIRFALVPLVAGIAYEIIRLAGRYDNFLTRTISAPGLWLQRLTTAEPDDSMLEVAIAALNAVRPVEDGSDKW